MKLYLKGGCNQQKKKEEGKSYRTVIHLCRRDRVSYPMPQQLLLMPPSCFMGYLVVSMLAFCFQSFL